MTCLGQKQDVLFMNAQVTCANIAKPRSILQRKQCTSIILILAVEMYSTIFVWLAETAI